MYFFRIGFFATMFLALAGCQPQENQQTKETPTNFEKESLATAKQLLETKCYTCHSPQGGHENRLAPPMIAIQKHYLRGNISQEAFIEQIVAFAKNPSAETAKMPGAIERFGLMPPQAFNEEELVLIAKYLYTQELPKPDWFQKHYEEEHGKETP